MALSAAPAVITANDRFKEGFGRWFWIGLILAALAHTVLFLFGPEFPVEGLGGPDERGPTVVIAHEVPPPERPPGIARPAAPVIGGPEVDPSLTIAPTDLGSNPPPLLPPPPSDDRGAGAGPPITPMTIRPQLENVTEVRRLLMHYYPPILRDSGIGGTVHVWFHIDESGRVMDTRLDRSSGYTDLDAAALRVADAMQFSPAWNRDTRVRVWVSVPITFEVERE